MLVTKVSVISVIIAQTSRDPIKIELNAARYIDFVVFFCFCFFIVRNKLFKRSRERSRERERERLKISLIFIKTIL